MEMSLQIVDTKQIAQQVEQLSASLRQAADDAKSLSETAKSALSEDQIGRYVNALESIERTARRVVDQFVTGNPVQIAILEMQDAVEAMDAVKKGLRA